MAAVVVAVLGAAFGAYSQISAGQDARNIANKNQMALYKTAADNRAIAAENLAIANREAGNVEATGQANVDLKRKEIARLMAYQRTQEAASGFRYEGTPELVASESAKEGEQDVATIWSNALTDAELVRAKGRVASMQGERIAGQLQTQGDIVAQQGAYAASGGIYQGASTLLSGVSNAYTISQYPSLVTSRLKV